METVSDRLRWARERAGFGSAAAAARALNVAEPTYAGHENGARGLRPKVLERYAQFFRVPLEWLATGRGQPGGAEGSAGDGPGLDRGELTGILAQDIFDLHSDEQLPVSVGEAAALAVEALHDLDPAVQGLGPEPESGSLRQILDAYLRDYRAALRKRRQAILRPRRAG